MSDRGKGKKLKKKKQIVSAPAPLKIGDRTFLVSAPTAKDSLTIYNWAVGHAKDSKSQGLYPHDYENLPLALQEVMVREYARARAKKRIDEQDIAEAITTTEGTAFMVWLSARHSHPALTLEEIRGMVTDDNYEQVYVDFAEATGLAAGDEDEEGDIDPKAPGSESSSPTTTAA